MVKIKPKFLPNFYMTNMFYFFLILMFLVDIIKLKQYKGHLMKSLSPSHLKLPVSSFPFSQK